MGVVWCGVVVGGDVPVPAGLACWLHRVASRQSLPAASLTHHAPSPSSPALHRPFPSASGV